MLIALIWIVVVCAIILGGVAMYAGFCTYLERKIAAHMQSRVGPYRVGPHGLLQWVADALKLLLKEDIVPDAADKILFRIAPYIVFAAVFTAFVTLPYSCGMSPADFDIGILFIMAVTSAVVAGILMAGWASGNKWSLFGAMRSAAQIVSYEIPVGLTLLGMLLMAGTLNLQSIVAQQGRGFFFNLIDGNTGMFGWFVFRYPPFTIIAFLVYYTASLAETNRTPFDIPEAESELVAGYHTEYSGMRFSFFFMAEYAEMFVVAAIATTVFLGGWLSPFGGFLGELVKSPFLIYAEGLFWFLGKTIFLVLVMMWIRWTLPRYRVDQLMDLCWKKLMPLAFINFVAIGVLERLIH